jgi:two-component system NtrC family sensor kinase
LLDFARQTQYAFETANINVSIRQALDLVSYQLTADSIRVNTNMTPELPEIKASLEHLQSVWLNLIINARDALREATGKRAITIGTAFDEDNEEILVSVHDTGRGMSETELDHIFEPFYTTKAPGEGTGLGLATCHRIVEQHGGHIEVASLPREGTTFIVHLPLSNAQSKNVEDT